MVCQYCYGYGLHRERCPLYIKPRAHYYCSICGDGIYNGDEYIVNDDYEYVHWECVDYARDLAKFLGYEIKELDDIE